MKIIQITDPHLVGHAGELYGRDPLARLQACLADIKGQHADAAFCVITGDLADTGDPQAYQALQTAISSLPMPCHLLIGNHDNRAVFADVFADRAKDANGYIQSSIEVGDATFIFMDTNDPATHSGCYDAPRLDWLQQQLALAAGRPTYLFMHHPPFTIGIPTLDNLMLRRPGQLARVLAQPGNNIKHLFLGHVHRPSGGSWRGIAFTTLPSLHHQVPLDLQAAGKVARNDEPPAYAIALIDTEQTVVHFHNFLGCQCQY